MWVDGCMSFLSKVFMNYVVLMDIICYSVLSYRHIVSFPAT